MSQLAVKCLYRSRRQLPISIIPRIARASEKWHLQIWLTILSLIHDIAHVLFRPKGIAVCTQCEGIIYV